MASPPSTAAPEAGRRIPVGGHGTNVHEAGGGPTLVLLHGSGPGVSAWSNWSVVIPALAEEFRVIAPDLPGFGLTEPSADGRYGMRSWVAHLVALLDTIGVERATIVGNSFGGVVALATALHHPDRVTGLVLLGTPAGEFPLTEGLHAGWHYEPDRGEMRRILELFPHEPAVVTDEMVESRYQLSARPGAQEAFRAIVPRPGQVGIDTVHAATAASLRRVGQPTLLLHGREDRVVPLQAGLFAQAHIPHSDLHVFGRCGHWVQHERRADFVRLVREHAAASIGIGRAG